MDMTCPNDEPTTEVTYPIVQCEKCDQKAANAGEPAERVCVNEDCGGMMVPNGETKTYTVRDY